MGNGSSCLGRGTFQWKLWIDPVKSLNKYVADKTLDPSCSIAQLELRALLDSPLAMRYLMSYSGERDCLDLVSLWSDCRKWAQTSPAIDPSGRLHGLLYRY